METVIMVGIGVFAILFLTALSVGVWWMNKVWKEMK
jgi:hypothetical protein